MIYIYIYISKISTHSHIDSAMMAELIIETTPKVQIAKMKINMEKFLYLLDICVDLSFFFPPKILKDGDIKKEIIYWKNDWKNENQKFPIYSYNDLY